MDFFGEDEGTTTTSSFLATVTESTPFRFDSIHAQTRSSLRITHIAVAAGTGHAAKPTFAQVRTLAAPTAEVVTTTVAGFPPSKGLASGLVSSTDIASSLNVLLDLDGFTELMVSGPATLLFFGEQSTQLIDENKHHNMFDEEDEGEEGEDDDDDDDIDFDAMHRLARD